MDTIIADEEEVVAVCAWKGQSTLSTSCVRGTCK